MPVCAVSEMLQSDATPGLRFNEHLDEEDGPLVFAHACKMGLCVGGGQVVQCHAYQPALRCAEMIGADAGYVGRPIGHAQHAGDFKIG